MHFNRNLILLSLSLNMFPCYTDYDAQFFYYLYISRSLLHSFVHFQVLIVSFLIFKTETFDPRFLIPNCREDTQSSDADAPRNRPLVDRFIDQQLSPAPNANDRRLTSPTPWPRRSTTDHDPPKFAPRAQDPPQQVSTASPQPSPFFDPEDDAAKVPGDTVSLLENLMLSMKRIESE